MRITWIGDSLAAGLGCDDVADTPAHLAARLLERPVDVTMLAVPGSKASDVIENQLDHVDPYTDLVVLCVGANDVATSVARGVYAEQVDRILTALAPIPVVMLTLPDISMADRMAEPLRSLAGARGRYFEAARAKVAGRHDHVVSVDIASRPAGPRPPRRPPAALRRPLPSRRRGLPGLGRAHRHGVQRHPRPAALPVPPQPVRLTRSGAEVVRCGRRRRCRSGVGPGRRG